jgi:hypothetical protein
VSNSPCRLAAVVATCRRLFEIEDEVRESRSRHYCPATRVAEPLPFDSIVRSRPSTMVLLFRLVFSSCFYSSQLVAAGLRCSAFQNDSVYSTVRMIEREGEG